MYRFFEKIFIICNFSVAFSNQKCYNTIIQFLFAWDLSYPTLFQSIAVFADLFLFFFCLRRGVLCLSIVASTFLLSIEFNSDSFELRTIIIKENYNVPAYAGEHRKYIDRRPIAPCRFYIYRISLKSAWNQL